MKIELKIFLLSSSLLWATWTTLAVFDSKSANAVTDNKFENIMSKLNEIKEEIKAIRKPER